jgi:hypothetical protein
VPIACGQHLDSPSTVARFLSLLEPCVQPGAHVLDVGAGGANTPASSLSFTPFNASTLQRECWASLAS